MTEITTEPSETPTPSAPSEIPAPTQFDAGALVEGTVSGITSFGAFVRIAPRIEGLVHISEIAHEYVANVENYVQLNQVVKVKVLGLNKKGKYDLSMKQANPAPAPSARPEHSDAPRTPRPAPSTPYSSGGGSGPSSPPYAPRGGGRYRKPEKEHLSPFEEKMSDFMKRSDEKQIDVKRNIQTKQGVKKRKKK
jgi:S1 RNA binding domain protein